DPARTGARLRRPAGRRGPDDPAGHRGALVGVQLLPRRPAQPSRHARYRAGGRSRVVMTVDVPTTGLDLIHLAAHEVYPGHHTEHAVKEQLLARDRGAIEESLQLVPTPQAVLSEGIAETGDDFLGEET